ncbi:MAG: hypothetical protein HOE90_20300 [Bacteriovoracaceae bacterium]|jgi:hypothetical protein|nr:hypothetical protein [Bacteriovoracaceae bacterium]
MKKNLVNDRGIFNLKSVPFGAAQDLELTEKDAFLNELLGELSEEVTDEIGVSDGKVIGISFTGNIIHDRNIKFGECGIIKGVLSSHFPAICSSSGILIIDSLSTEVNACFVSEEFKEDKPGYDREVDILIGEVVYDLYYYDRFFCDFRECLHEYAFLAKNQYPKKVEPIQTNEEGDLPQ